MCDFLEGLCGPRDLTDILDMVHTVVVSVIYYVLSETEDKLVSLMIMFFNMLKWVSAFRGKLFWLTFTYLSMY